MQAIGHVSSLFGSRARKKYDWAFFRDKIAMPATVITTVLMTCQVKAQGTAPDEQCRIVAQTLTSDLKGADTWPTFWQDADVSGVAQMSSDGWFVCTMEQAGQQRGYAIVARQAGSPKVVMFSGSTIPGKFLTKLSLATDDTVPVPPRAFTELRNIPMVGPIDEQPKGGTARVTAGPVASSLATVLLARQLSPDATTPPLFPGHMGVIEYSKFVARFSSTTRPAVPSGDPTRQTPGSGARLRRESDKREEILDKKNLIKYDRDSRSGFTYRDGVQVFDIVSPMLQSYLVEQITPLERLRLLQDEENYAASVPIHKSRGMIIAYILEHGYLKHATSIEDGIRQFARTRGFSAVLARVPVSQVQPRDLPCLLLGPDGMPAILLAVSTDQAGWGLVSIPETVRPVRETAFGASRPARPEDIVLPPAHSVHPRPPETERRMRELLYNMVSVTDPGAQLPGSLGQGAHILFLRTCERDWKALTITEWRPLQN